MIIIGDKLFAAPYKIKKIYLSFLGYEWLSISDNIRLIVSCRGGRLLFFRPGYHLFECFYRAMSLNYHEVLVNQFYIRFFLLNHHGYLLIYIWVRDLDVDEYVQITIRSLFSACNGTENTKLSYPIFSRCFLLVDTEDFNDFLKTFHNSIVL